MIGARWFDGHLEQHGGGVRVRLRGNDLFAAARALRELAVAPPDIVLVRSDFEAVAAIVTKVGDGALELVLLASMESETTAVQVARCDVGRASGGLTAKRRKNPK